MIYDIWVTSETSDFKDVEFCCAIEDYEGETFQASGLHRQDAWQRHQDLRLGAIKFDNADFRSRADR